MNYFVRTFVFTLPVDTMEINGFDWDDGNREKCKKHGITIDEVESVFNDKPFVSSNARHQSEEERYHAVGKTFQVVMLMLFSPFARHMMEF